MYIICLKTYTEIARAKIRELTHQGDRDLALVGGALIRL